MAIFSSYTDAPYFVADSDSSATAYNQIWENARLVDLISLRARDAFQAHQDPPEDVGTNPLPIWQGGFQFRAGMTTATLKWFNSLAGLAERLRVNFNGVQVADDLATAGDQTQTITLTGRGYADRQVIEVKVFIFSNSYPPGDVGGSAWGRYQLIDAYASPLAGIMTTAWTPAPTFTNSLDPVKLNQLSNASDFLALRLGLLPMPLFQSFVYATGEYWSGSNKALWNGGITRSGGFNRLRANVSYDIVSNMGESLRMKINGAVVSSIGPFNAGTKGSHVFDLDLSGYADGTPLRLQYESLITSEPTGNPPQPSRYHLFEAALTPGAGVSMATMPAKCDYLESMTWATFKGRLNALAAIFNAVKARIDAAPDIYDRARFYRHGYGYDDGQKEYFQNRHVPLRKQRIGAVLVVRGKGVSLGWGPATVEAPAELGGEYVAKSAYNETLIGGDKVDTKIVYLDTLPGLEVGAPYVLRGSDIRYAAEYLR